MRLLGGSIDGDLNPYDRMKNLAGRCLHSLGSALNRGRRIKMPEATTHGVNRSHDRQTLASRRMDEEQR